MSDILPICTKRRRMYGYSVAPDVGMNGFPVTRIKSHACVPTPNVTAHTGRNPAGLR